MFLCWPVNCKESPGFQFQLLQYTKHPQHTKTDRIMNQKGKVHTKCTTANLMTTQANTNRHNQKQKRSQTLTHFGHQSRHQHHLASLGSKPMKECFLVSFLTIQWVGKPTWFWKNQVQYLNGQCHAETHTSLLSHQCGMFFM